MRRRRLTSSPQQIREKLPAELGHLDPLAELQPDAATLVAEWREFSIELQLLAATDMVDHAKAEEFLHRLRDYKARKKAKGIDPLIWMAEDLESHARGQQVT